MKKIKRTLYECFNAKVNNERIYCSEGYPLARDNASIEPFHLAKGEKLAMKICQQCVEFTSMGPPVPADEKGWDELKGAC